MVGKKAIAIALITLLGITSSLTSPAVHAEEIVEYLSLTVSNGGFEASASELTDWNVSPALPVAGLEVYVAQDRAFSGSNSVKIVDNNNTKSLDVFSGKIPVTAGKTYRLTAKVFVTAKSVRGYLRFKKSGSNTDLAGSLNTQLISILTSNNGWQTLSIEAVAPAGSEFAEISFYMGASGTGTAAYIDEVKLEEKKVTVINQLELPFDAPITIGDAVSISLSQSAAYGIGPDGRAEQYLTTVGSPAYFHAVDAVTGEVLFSEAMGNDTIWAMTSAPDGNIYIGKTTGGELYRYVSKERKLELLGINPSNKVIYDIKASNDGKIYGGTYSNTGTFGRVFEYDIKTATFRDLGVMKDGEQYVRGIGVTENYLYAGTGTNAHLMRYDRSTGEITELTIPGVSGNTGTLSEIVIAGGRLLVHAGAKLHVLEEETGQYITTLDFQSKVSSPSPYNPDLIYYKLAGELYTYNLQSNEVTKVEGIPELPSDSAIKAHGWITPTKGTFAGKTVLAGMAAFSESFLYDPVTNTYEVHVADVPPAAATVNAMSAKGDYVYIGGYQRGMSIYDTKTGKFIYNNKMFHQPEGIGFLGDTVYFGTYSGAKIYRLDMTKPLSYSEWDWANPGLAVDLEYDQDRPFTMTSGEGKLFIGTFPTYGKLGGALTILEEQLGTDGTVTGVTTETFHNIVPNQSLFGLAYKNGRVYGSTSRVGGLGIDPTEPEAKMFVFDVASKQVTTAPFTPSFPGVSGALNLIGELSIGADGLLWGIADSTVLKADGTVNNYDAVLFAMNPDTMTVVKSKVITQASYNTSKYRPYYLVWGPDGLLYTTIGRQLFAVDPEDLRAKQIVNGTINLMTLGSDGSIYYIIGSKLYKIPVKIDHVSLEVGSTELVINETTTATATVQLINGQEAAMGSADIQYVSSNPAVAAVTNGTLKALSPGTAVIYSLVKLDGRTVQSSPVSVKVVEPVTVSTVCNINKLSSNQEFKADITVTNREAEKISVLAIAALFDSDNRLININTVSAQINSKDAAVLSPGFTLPEVTGGYKVKVFVWNGSDIKNTNMKPFADAITIE